MKKLTIDIHSHLIPAIDDGARNMEESLELIHGLASLGYKKVITTPHIMVDCYPNTKQDILERLKLLRIAVKKANIDIVLDAAAEYYLDDMFLSYIQKDDLLLISGEYVLFETSYLSKPLQFDNVIYEICAAGYKPLLAHPERYQYIKEYQQEYKSLKDRGIYFQVNINSFSGYYGKDAKQKAKFLSDYGMIDFLGSDTHRLVHIEKLSIMQKKNTYHEIFLKNTILNNTL